MLIDQQRFFPELCIIKKNKQRKPIYIYYYTASLHQFIYVCMSIVPCVLCNAQRQSHKNGLKRSTEDKSALLVYLLISLWVVIIYNFLFSNKRKSSFPVIFTIRPEYKIYFVFRTDFLLCFCENCLAFSSINLKEFFFITKYLLVCYLKWNPSN